jgi:hypothetical protein
LTDTDTIQGSEGPAGTTTANLTESHNVQGTGSFTFNYAWLHSNSDGNLVASGIQEFSIKSSRDYHDQGTYTGRPNPVLVPTDAGGEDSVTIKRHVQTTPAGGSTVDTKYLMYTYVDYRAPGSPAVPADPTDPETYPALPAVPAGVIGQEVSSASKWWQTVTGQAPTDSDTYVPPMFDGRDWFAKSADFAAGMGDAVSCGLTQRIRAAGGFDDVVDKNSGWYKGGEIAGTVVSIAAAGANPCNAAAGIKLAIKGVSAVQGVGQLVNAADAAENGDPLGFVLNVVGARMSFGKLGQACFAAGTSLYDSWTTAKPIEQFQVGDTILSRDENDPAGLPVLKQVEEVFVGQARILHLHAGGQVLRTTALHPFWVEGKGWTEAERLKPGDRLGSHDGKGVVVRELYDTGETETVYNLRIADYHTYFVGCPAWGWSVWAHNDCIKFDQRLNGGRGGWRNQGTGRIAKAPPAGPGQGSQALDQLNSIQGAQDRIRSGVDGGRRIIDSVKGSEQSLKNILRGKFDPADWR